MITVSDNTLLGTSGHFHLPKLKSTRRVEPFGIAHHQIGVSPASHATAKNQRPLPLILHLVTFDPTVSMPVLMMPPNEATKITSATPTTPQPPDNTQYLLCFACQCHVTPAFLFLVSCLPTTSSTYASRSQRHPCCHGVILRQPTPTHDPFPKKSNHNLPAPPLARQAAHVKHRG
jgi:hypothetical protein